MSDASLAWIRGAFGLIGAAIGGAVSVATVWIQSKVQDLRARLAQVMQLASEDRKHCSEHSPEGSQLLPLELFVHYHTKIMEALDGNISR
jgi:hypothetical protein